MLYHLLTLIPPQLTSQIPRSGLFRPSYSRHASTRAIEYQIDLPSVLDYKSLVPFELECNRDGRVIKVAYRTRYKGVYKAELNPDINLDLILVINRPSNLVRTVWLNPCNDHHKTLNLSKYQNQSV